MKNEGIELKTYDELLCKDEEELLISYLEDKISFLNSDLKTLRDEYSLYTKVLNRFITEEAVDKFTKRIIKDYKYKITEENEDILLVINEDEVGIKKKVRTKDRQDRLIAKKRLLRNAFNGEKIVLDFVIEEDDEKDEMQKNKRELLDAALYDLNYCRSAEVSDINYYKRVIEKLKTNGKVSCSDSQELWCMCDNKENEGIHNDLHKILIDKLKAYASQFSQDDEEED